MGSFKDYIHEDEDVKATIAKLPKQFQELVKGYEVRFQIGNTLSGDDDHVGVITSKDKKIIISSPFFYSRQFVLLHEIAHLVYEAYIRGTELESEWKKISLSTKNRKKDEPAEELFSHAFANQHAKHKVPIHDHQEWKAFIEKISKLKKPNRKL